MKNNASESWRGEWLANAELRSEFYSVDHYIAFKQAEADGRARIARGGTLRLSDVEKSGLLRQS